MKIIELCKGLTVHGAWLIFNVKESKLFRFFWTIAIFASIGGLSFYYYLLYIKFNVMPDINVRVRPKFITELPFPAMTICLPMFARSSLVNFTEIARKMKFKETNLNLTAEEQSYLAANIQACDPSTATSFKPYVMKRTSNDIMKLLNDSSLTLVEAIFNCHYKEFRLKCDKGFNRVLTDRGFCYSFNMQSFQTIFNEKVISKDFHSYKRTNIAKSLFALNKLYNETVSDENDTFSWSLDYGYAEQHDADSVPIKIEKRKQIGFNILMKERDSTNICSLIGNVFSISLHLPNEVKLPSQREHYVEFNARKEIFLTAVSYTADESMRKFSPKNRGCYFEGERKLKFFRTYTRALCEFECLTNYTLKMCGCVKFSMPRTQATPVCSLDKIDCYFQAMNVWPEHFTSKDRFEVTCGCLKTCNDIKYNFKYDKTSSSENVMYVFDVFNLSRKDAVSRVSVVFNDFEVLEFEEYASYKVQNFVADLGGLLGFFLGCSILSIIEISYLTLETIACQLKLLSITLADRIQAGKGR